MSSKFAEYDNRQIVWQNFRNEFYQRLQDEAQRAANNRRASEKRMSTNDRYAESEQHKIQTEAHYLDDIRREHERMVRVDTRMKNARRTGDVAGYLSALSEAETLMQQHRR